MVMFPLPLLSWTTERIEPKTKSSNPYANCHESIAIHRLTNPGNAIRGRKTQNHKYEDARSGDALEDHHDHNHSRKR
jgi:hypothetical protein